MKMHKGFSFTDLDGHKWTIELVTAHSVSGNKYRAHSPTAFPQRQWFTGPEIKHMIAQEVDDES